MTEIDTPPPSFTPGKTPRKRITKNAPTYSHETGPLKIPQNQRRVIRTANPPYSTPPSTGRVISNKSQDDLQTTPTSRGDVKSRAKRIEQKNKALPKKKLIILSVLAIIIFIIAGTLIYVANTYFELKNSIHTQKVLSDAKNLNKGAEVYLIVGNDARSGDAKKSVVGARADTIMVLIKPSASSGKKAVSVSVPRDTAVDLPDFVDNNAFFGAKGNTVSGYRSKINASYNYGGPNLLVKTIEQLSGLKVNHYSEVGFDALVGLTDSLGGIRLCYDKDVDDSASKMKWKAGCHNANGKQALAFSRMRHQDPEGDLGRAKRQRQVVQKIAKKSTNLFKEGNLFNLWNIGRLKETAKAGLDYVTFDEDASLWGVKIMADAFGEATSSDGEKIIPIITPNGYDSKLGSIVKIDPDEVKRFFQSKI